MLTSRRTEALMMVQSLLSQSPDIQKILAFEGAFERLFAIIQQEGGLEGGHMVHDALACVDSLLRYNTSNQVAHLVLCPFLCSAHVISLHSVLSCTCTCA